MVTLMSHQSRRERRQGNTDTAAAAAAAATSRFPAGVALGVAGLATASTAITCMVTISQSSSSSVPPPPVLLQGNDGGDSSRCYLLALSSGLFYSGIAEVGAAVWVMAEAEPRAGRRLAYASLVPLTPAVVGLLAAATLFW